MQKVSVKKLPIIYIFYLFGHVSGLFIIYSAAVCAKKRAKIMNNIKKKK